jgi:hypothetical protein
MPACRIVAIVGLLLVTPPSARAQVSDQQLPCEAFSQSAAVFVGVAGTPVVQMVDLSNQPSFALKVTPMLVERAYLGLIDATIFVTASGIDEPFTPGRTYLVYGREYSDRHRIVAASPGFGAKDIETAANDVAFLDGLPHGVVGGTIVGTVQQKERVYGEYDGPDRVLAPLAGITVGLVGEHFTADVITDNHGRFAASGLPSGRYELIPQLPRVLTTGDSTSRITVVVRDGGCATKTIDVVANGTVHGVLRGPDGHPLTSTSLDLVPIDVRPDPFSGHIRGAGSVRTNERGEFEFMGRAAGRYYLGLSLYNAPNPFGPSYPRSYYPGTTTREEAVPVIIEHDGTPGSYDFSVPYILRKGEVSITVEAAGAIGAATVCFVELDDRVSRQRIFDVTAGVPIAMPVVDGARYHVHAHLKGSLRQLESEPYEFTATTDTHHVTLRPDRTTATHP